MAEKLEMVDAVYMISGLSVASCILAASRELKPVNVFPAHISVTRKYLKDFKRFYRIGKQPKITPNWYLRRLVKKIYGK